MFCGQALVKHFFFFGKVGCKKKTQKRITYQKESLSKWVQRCPIFLSLCADLPIYTGWVQKGKVFNEPLNNSNIFSFQNLICFWLSTPKVRFLWPPRRQNNPPRICLASVKLVYRKISVFHHSVVVAAISASSAQSHAETCLGTGKQDPEYGWSFI